MATVQSKTLASLDRVLRLGPWNTHPWPARSQRIGETTLLALRQSLGVLPPATAWASACGTARATFSTAPGPWHQRHTNTVLVWALRSLVTAVQTEPDVFVAEGLDRLAAELGEVCSRVPELDLAIDTDSMVTHLKNSLSQPQTHDFASIFLQHCADSAGVFIVGHHSLDNVLQTAVERADSAWQKLSSHPRATLAQRRAWATVASSELAWSLAALSIELGELPGEGRAALWLSHKACAIAARSIHAGLWVRATTSRTLSTETPSTTQTPPHTEPTMTTPHDTKANFHPLLKTLETDAGDAAWRTAGSQFVKLARDPIVALLSRHLAPDDLSVRARIAAFLETELGAALLSGVLSTALLTLPQSDVTAKLGRELRVRAMAGAGDLVADLLTGPLRQIAVMFIHPPPVTSAQQNTPSAATHPALDPAGLPDSSILDALRTAVSAEA